MHHPLDNSFSLFRWNYRREGVRRCLLSSCLHFGPSFPSLCRWSGAPAAAGRILRGDRLFSQSVLNNWSTRRASQLAFRSRFELPGVYKQRAGGLGAAAQASRKSKQLRRMAGLLCGRRSRTLIQPLPSQSAVQSTVNLRKHLNPPLLTGIPHRAVATGAG